MSYRYSILGAEPTMKYCVVGGRNLDVTERIKLRDGISLNGMSLSNNHFYMDDEAPGIQLVDFVANTDRMLIVSQQAKAILQAQALANIEYVQVSIFDHKERLASSDYFIVNIIGSLDCLNQDKSLLKRGRINPESVHAVNKVVLHEEKISSEQRLFRVTLIPFITIIRDDLVAVLKKHKMKGFTLYPLNEDIGL